MERTTFRVDLRRRAWWKGLESLIERDVRNGAHFDAILREHRRADQLRSHIGGFEVHPTGRFCVSGGGAQEEHDKTNPWQMCEHGHRAEDRIAQTEFRAVCSCRRVHAAAAKAMEPIDIPACASLPGEPEH